MRALAVSNSLTRSAGPPIGTVLSVDPSRSELAPPVVSRGTSRVWNDKGMRTVKDLQEMEEGPAP